MTDDLEMMRARMRANEIAAAKSLRRWRIALALLTLAVGAFLAWRCRP